MNGSCRGQCFWPSSTEILRGFVFLLPVPPGLPHLSSIFRVFMLLSITALSTTGVGCGEGSKIGESNEGPSKAKRQMKTPFQLETLEKAYASMCTVPGFFFFFLLFRFMGWIESCLIGSFSPSYFSCVM